MKNIAISGSWRWGTEPQVERDVRAVVRQIMSVGNGIVTGGALGVDSVALDEALKYDPKANRIKLFLPTSLAIYETHYQKRADEGVITHQQADQLINQLNNLSARNRRALIEDQTTQIVNKDSYYARNTQIIEAADELIAFHVIADDTQGAGTRDIIEKAKGLQKPVKVYEYDLRLKEHT